MIVHPTTTDVALHMHIPATGASAAQPSVSVVWREVPVRKEDVEALGIAENELVSQYIGHVGSYLWGDMLS